MKSKALIFLLLLLVSTPIVSADYRELYLEISKGNVPGHTFVHVKGLDESVGTTEYVIWDEGVYVFPVVATLMNVSSSSVNDDDGNTGAWNVTIYGLDINYNQINETVTMNGQTPVTTTLQYYRVNRMETLYVGTNTQNVGIIYIGTGATVAGKPTVVYREIPAGFGVSATAVYTIPNDKTGYLKYFSFGTDSSKIIELSMKTRCLDCIENGWSVDYHDHFAGVGRVHDLPLPYSLPEHTDLKITARNTVGDAFATVDMFIILVDDGYEDILDEAQTTNNTILYVIALLIVMGFLVTRRGR